MSWPLCIICGRPVTCGQGRAHYACLAWLDPAKLES